MKSDEHAAHPGARLPTACVFPLRVAMLALAVVITGCTSHGSARRMIQYPELLTLPTQPADHRLHYGTDPLQVGELRLPAGNDTVPLVVFIHGGCWRAQYDVSHVGAAATALVRDGYAVWAIEYRRVGDVGGGWPGTFDDVARAVDHVRALAPQYPRIDTSRVVLMGHSAGGQLALWAASRKQNEMTGLFRSSMPPLSVRGVVSLAGITDLAQYGAAPGSCNTAVTPLMGGTPAVVGSHYKAVSPIERVPIGVPLRLIHGEADPIVPLSQAKAFLNVARAEGDSAQLDVVAGAGHFDLVAPNSEAWPVVMRALESLTRKAPSAPRVHAGGE